MKRIKTLLIFSLVIALSFSLLGCKLLTWGDSAAEETAAIAELPQWLTLAHRAEAAEEPEEEEEEEEANEEEDKTEAPAQSATTQPATTQPAQTEQPTKSSGTPKYLQPGTMEYLAKIQLDQSANDYKRLNTQIANADKNEADTLKKTRAGLYDTMKEIAENIGIDLQKEYGISSPSGGSSDWFNNWDESPSGFGD